MSITFNKKAAPAADQSNATAHADLAPPASLSLEQALAHASGLNKNSAPVEISQVLQMVAKEKIIRRMRNQTGVRIGVLSKQLGAIEWELPGASPDKAWALAKRLLYDAFKDGAHLLRSVDGTYWTFIGTHWRPTTGAQLCKMLMAQAMKSNLGCASFHQLVGNAKKTLDYMLASDVDLIGVQRRPPPRGQLLEWRGLARQGRQARASSALPGKPADVLLADRLQPERGLSDVRQDSVRDFRQGRLSRRDGQAFARIIRLHPAAAPRHRVLLAAHRAGANGKSKFLETLQRLVGPDAVMNGSISKFQSDRFNMAALVGKLLFVDDDMGVTTHLDDGLLKAISEAKEMSARHAYGERHFKFRCLALPVIAGNHFPTTTDNSHGLRRRAMVIPFDRQFGPDDADKELFPKIWQFELSGVLNRALDGLARLRSRGDFLPPEDCVRAAQEFMAHANPLVAFIEDEMIADPDGHITLKEFRGAMKEWALDQNVKKPVPYKTLKRQLEGLRYEVKMVEGYHRVCGLTQKA